MAGTAVDVGGQAARRQRVRPVLTNAAENIVQAAIRAERLLRYLVFTARATSARPAISTPEAQIAAHAASCAPRCGPACTAADQSAVAAARGSDASRLVRTADRKTAVLLVSNTKEAGTTLVTTATTGRAPPLSCSCEPGSRCRSKEKNHENKERKENLRREIPRE